MIELKSGAGELTGRVTGDPEELLEELADAVALVLDRVEDLMREQRFSTATRANLPNVLWQSVRGKWRGVRKEDVQREDAFREEDWHGILS